MRTPSERNDPKRKCSKNKKGQVFTYAHGIGVAQRQERKEILAESEKLVIKPGMKLVYDEELNMMVWR